MKYEVNRTCFYDGERYAKGDTISLDDENVVYNYRSMGYIGREVKTAKRKGRRVKNAVAAK